MFTHGKKKNMQDTKRLNAPFRSKLADVDCGIWYVSAAQPPQTFVPQMSILLKTTYSGLPNVADQNCSLWRIRTMPQRGDQSE